MGSEKSWQPKDWWSSLGKNGWPLLMGSFWRGELLCAISAQTRRALLTDLLSYLLWINYLSILSWFWTSLSAAVISHKSQHTQMVLNIRSFLSPKWTTILQLRKRLWLAKNKIHCAKHTWAKSQERDTEQQQLWPLLLNLSPFQHHPFSTLFTKVSSTLEQWACISLKRTLVNVNWCFQNCMLSKIWGLWLITKYTLCYIQEY